MKIIKFGGKSLANGQGLNQVISIIENQYRSNEQIAVVVSARGDTTDHLLDLLALAKEGHHYQTLLQELIDYQLAPASEVDISAEVELLSSILKGISLTKDYTAKVKDLVLAQGELLSAKTVSHLVKKLGISSSAVDSRRLLRTDNHYGAANIVEADSMILCGDYIKSISHDTCPIITGFIASDKDGNTTTLGRNGSNYSASLIAKFVHATEVSNYTHIDGIYTANPDIVSEAKIIKALHYDEASELAGFGASILHPKTIGPLIEEQIPFRILNTFAPKKDGTLINAQAASAEIKCISTKDDVSLVTLRGKGLLGKVGIDARVFACMQQLEISVGIVSQGSSEKAVSFIIPSEKVEKAVAALNRDFQAEIASGDVQDISSDDGLSVVTIIGQSINHFASSIKHLEQNNINIQLINNTITGRNISLIIDQKDSIKAVNIIHSQVFGATKRINVAIIGKGTVGGTLIDQIIRSSNEIEFRKGIRLNVFAIAGSDKILFTDNGIPQDWRSEFTKARLEDNITNKIIEFAHSKHYENLVVIDNTASDEFVDNYPRFIEAGFDLVSSNKIANTQSYASYLGLRKSMKTHQKHYLYETNVGAGLPIIDTIRVLHDSGENITRIRGVFSGSLSYVFNSFSSSKEPFSHFLQSAIDRGYTEPDPREDLCGNDVARKLLILARELELANEFEDISVQNLIPNELRNVSKTDFLKNLTAVDSHFEQIKSTLGNDQVLRYVAELTGDLQSSKGDLSVQLIKVEKSSALGNLKGTDSIIEIYTESYGENAITIIGAGAGAEVTARGVLGDLLRISEKK